MNGEALGRDALGAGAIAREPVPGGADGGSGRAALASGQRSPRTFKSRVCADRRNRGLGRDPGPAGTPGDRVDAGRGAWGSPPEYRDIGRPLDRIVSDVDLLARSALRALRLDDPIPHQLSTALADLAYAADALAARIGAVEEHPEVSSPALKAVAAATELAPTGQNTSSSVLVAYTQATAADLLRALGIDRDPAHELVVETAEKAFSRSLPIARSRATTAVSPRPSR